MDEEILFTITKQHLDTGLRGFPVGYCTTSFVDSKKGLFYMDRPVSLLAGWEPIQVIYLLYYGKEGTAKETNAFAQLIQDRAILHPEVVQAIYALPRKGHPMKLFSAAILILGMLEGTGDYREDCLNLIAKMPHLAACVINHHSGSGKTSEPQPKIGYMESFEHLLKIPRGTQKDLVAAFKLFNILLK